VISEATIMSMVCLLVATAATVDQAGAPVVGLWLAASLLFFFSDLSRK